LETHSADSLHELSKWIKAGIPQGSNWRRYTEGSALLSEYDKRYMKKVISLTPLQIEVGANAEFAANGTCL
jgi:hypothetical protein